MKKFLCALCLVVFCSSLAKADIRNLWNPSKIHYAIQANDAIAVIILINDDPKCLNSQQWNRGLTPLMLATENGNLDIVTILLNAGADLNLRSCGGNTALHYAVENNHTEIAKLLTDHGADRYTLNKSRQFPVGMAAYNRNYELLQYWKNSTVNPK